MSAPVPFLAPPPPRFRLPQVALTVALAAVVILGVIAVFRKGTLPAVDEIDPGLLAEPVQRPTTRETFSFEYRGVTYDVEPVAEYEIQGLVVAHNDTSSIGDVYHDSSSVDTKDVGMIWGDNLRTDDFRKCEYRSGSWTCYVEWPAGVKFHLDSMSNTHIVTGDDEVRGEVGRIRVGDQVRLTGLLVNYRDGRRPDSWRRSSTVRQDTGNGACEVMFLEEIEFLDRGTPVWYLVYELAWWLAPAILVAKGVLWMIGFRASRAR
ncbi:MAG: hypothetical protein HY720_32090 [Planctomycetes bacterium]|nr:hypothetical protein [Planctomycetota bacterium]